MCYCNRETSAVHCRACILHPVAVQQRDCCELAAVRWWRTCILHLVAVRWGGCFPLSDLILQNEDPPTPLPSRFSPVSYILASCLVPHSRLVVLLPTRANHRTRLSPYFPSRSIIALRPLFPNTVSGCAVNRPWHWRHWSRRLSISWTTVSSHATWTT